jgi:hypothetical protein
MPRPPVSCLSGESVLDDSNKDIIYQDRLETSTFQFFRIVLRLNCYIFIAAVMNIFRLVLTATI